MLVELIQLAEYTQEDSMREMVITHVLSREIVSFDDWPLALAVAFAFRETHESATGLINRCVFRLAIEMSSDCTYLICPTRQDQIEHFGFPSLSENQSICDHCESLELSTLLLRICTQREFGDKLAVHSNRLLDAFLELVEFESLAPLSHLLDLCESAVPLFSKELWQNMTENQIMRCIETVTIRRSITHAEVITLSEELSARGFPRAIALLVKSRLSR